MAGSVAAVLGATRNSAVFSAPWTTTTALPADTVLEGTAWGATWVDRGYTQGGIEVGIAVSRTDIKVDQVLDAILKPIDSRTVTFKTMLAQMGATPLAIAAGQGAVTTTAASSGVRGHDDFDLAATVADTYYSWGLDILNDGDGEAFRVFVPKGLPVDGPTMKFGDPTTNAQLPINIQALPDSGRTPTAILKVRDVIPALP